MINFLSILTQPDNLPVTAMAVALVFLLVVWGRQALAPGDGGEDVRASGLPDRADTWPYLVRIEFLATLITIIILIVWSITIDAPLEAPADANVTPDPSKAPWYFVGLQELLVYFDPWIAGVMLPGLIIVGLIAIPYVDPNPKGNGYYTWKERPLAISIFLFGFVGLWIVPMLIGIFCRGPGWGWYWPWESWDIPKITPQPSRNLSDFLGFGSGPGAFVIGAAAVGLWYGSAVAFWVKYRDRVVAAGLDRWRYAVVAFLLLSMAAVPVKMALRLLFDMKYVWVTPWFNI